ncbi:30S ribosomal protein S12, partial [Francisella tularensis subsp. holarctica]|nr:30S ribosomal protein S12 [Francisella tularensis subsp. holarctica]
MATINKLVNNPSKRSDVKSIVTAVKACPPRRGVCTRVYT